MDESAKDIMDHITAKYGASMSPQYSNMLALLTSGKGSEAAVPKDKEPSSKGKGNHSYIKPSRTDSDSNHKKAEPPTKKQKRDPNSGPEVANTWSGGSKKKPKKSTKKAPKSKKTISESDNSDNSGAMCGKLHSQPTKEEISKHQCQHTEKWGSDLPGIHTYCQQKGIIPENPPPFNYKDHSDYLRQLLCNNNKLELNIMSISDLLKQYKKDSSGTGRKHYKALKMLSSSTMGKSGTSPLYMAEVLKVPQMKELVTPNNVNGYYSQIMTGLYSLFAHDMISKITTSDTGNKNKTVSECCCLLCVYVVGSHMLMNNHISYHLRLVLLCCIKHCFYVETQAKGIRNHVVEKHHMPQGDSATGKK